MLTIDQISGYFPVPLQQRNPRGLLVEYIQYLIEYRIIERTACGPSYHCYIRFPEILQKSGLSADSGRKILIRIDSEAKGKLYDPAKVFLNKFAVYRQIFAAPAGILLAQKMMTVIHRKREKGRDVFDASFLMGFSKPDYGYIEKILGMKRTEFLRRFNKRVEELDLNFLARDVEPFLFTPEQQERVLTFREYWNKIGNG